MSGHNKWSKIHRKKEIQDQKKGSIFTKLGKDITIAVKKGGNGDPDNNFALRLAIDKARAANMPKDNIQRAIDRGLGKTGEGEMIELSLEGYGPQGVAVLVEAITDNRNRTVAEVKNLFDKSGGSLAEPGAVMYLFKRVGRLKLKTSLDEEELLALIDAGVEDVIEEEGKSILICMPEQLKSVVEAVGQKFGQEQIEEAGVVYQAKVKKKVENPASVDKFLANLKAMDDVQEVYVDLEF